MAHRRKNRQVVSSSVRPRVADALERRARDHDQTRSRSGEELLEKALVEEGYLEPRGRGRRGGRRR